ncbi:MAG: hypothetical protein HKN76_04385, partial [Saprospiraceae bacterium]|nr:hypothetical protein [Saprospiraceae bacterium]
CCFLIALSVLFLIDPPLTATGIIHEEFGSMLKSGPGVQFSRLQKFLFLLVGVLIIVIFCLMLYIGLDNRNTRVPNRPKMWILISSILYVSVFIILAFTAWHYFDNQSDVFIAGFPLPSAIMLFGLTLVPLFFTMLYILGFENWIFSRDDLAKFEAILRSRKERNTDQL